MLDFLKTYAIELSSIAAIIAIVEFIWKPIRNLFTKSDAPKTTNKVKADRGGIAVGGDVKGNISTKGPKK
jgi:hypothetical protein